MTARRLTAQQRAALELAAAAGVALGASIVTTFRLLRFLAQAADNERTLSDNDVALVEAVVDLNAEMRAAHARLDSLAAPPRRPQEPPKPSPAADDARAVLAAPTVVAQARCLACPTPEGQDCRLVCTEIPPAPA